MATGNPRGNGRDGGRKISKGGMRLMMESPGQELAPSRILVNAIALGAIQTPISAAAGRPIRPTISL
jgi:NAD(P)-dependent dehydrogenase (short-subunit alcohol dehydrogenase family)